jgi:hypothetical protein
MAPGTGALTENTLLCYIQQRFGKLQIEDLIKVIEKNVSSDKVQAAVSELELAGYTFEAEGPDSPARWVVGVVAEQMQVEEPADIPRFFAFDVDMIASLVKSESCLESEPAHDDIILHELQRLSKESAESRAILEHLSKQDKQKQVQIDHLKRLMETTPRKDGAIPSRPASASNAGDANDASGSVMRQPAYAQVAAHAHTSVDSVPAASDTEWTEVRRKRRPVFIGTAATSTEGSGELQGVERQVHMYIGRCNPGTTADCVKAYCSARQVTLVSCEKNVPIEAYSNYSLTSFHLVAQQADKDKLMQCEFWPTNVTFRGWRFGKSPNKTVPNGSFN